MKVLITGVCGFVGSNLALALLEQGRARGESIEVIGIDNLIRQGSQFNRSTLTKAGARFFHADLRNRDDVDSLPACDWVIDAAANASVLAGVDGQSSSRQLFDHNLSSTLHILEYCKVHKAGFVLLSTSRVYSIKGLATLPMAERDGAYIPDAAAALPGGISSAGVSEAYSTAPPISLYGASKLASELLALEYGETFGFPVWINRCGVMAGAGQFGKADQGIFSFWINAYLRRRPLKYIGFNGKGWQSRDAFHPRDLLPLLEKQMTRTGVPPDAGRIYNLGGGAENTYSLNQLSRWCALRFGEHPVAVDARPRAFDIPWMAMDCRAAEATWGWKPRMKIEEILEQIAVHAIQNENWLEISGA